MKNIFKTSTSEILNTLSKWSGEELVYRVLPHFIMEIITKYFRLEVIGEENLPKSGRFLVTPNHSGFSGFDAMVLNYQLTQLTGRLPQVMTHRFWFLTPTTAVPAQRLGFIEANLQNGIAALRKDKIVVIFPEGEQGNFKPTAKAYQLQEFRRGFVRMALRTESPIVPTLILGAEETSINLKRLKLTKYLRGVVLPLPLNILPLPAKWRIRFLEPISFPYKPSAADDQELVRELAEEVQEKMQQALNQELSSRGSVFL